MSYGDNVLSRRAQVKKKYVEKPIKAPELCARFLQHAQVEHTNNGRSRLQCGSINRHLLNKWQLEPSRANAGLDLNGDGPTLLNGLVESALDGALGDGVKDLLPAACAAALGVDPRASTLAIRAVYHLHEEMLGTVTTDLGSRQHTRPGSRMRSAVRLVNEVVAAVDEIAPGQGADSVRKGPGEALMVLLKRGSPVTKIAAAACICDASKSEEYSTALSGAIPELVAMLRIERPELCRSVAASALRVLSTWPKNVDSVRQSGAIPGLVRLLSVRGAATQAAMMNRSLVALGKLCERPDARKATFDAGVVDPLLVVLERGAPMVQAAAAHLLCVLYLLGEKALVTHAVPQLVKMLGSGSRLTGNAALKCVEYLSRTPEEKTAFAEAGALDTLAVMLFACQAKMRPEVLRAMESIVAHRPVAQEFRKSRYKLAELSRYLATLLQQKDKNSKLLAMSILLKLDEFGPLTGLKTDPDVAQIIPDVKRRKDAIKKAAYNPWEAKFNARELKELKLRFQKCDKDKSGTIDQGEMKQLLAMCGHKCSGTRLKKIMESSIDQKKVGEVTWNEFLQFINEMKHGKGKSMFDFGW